MYTFNLSDPYFLPHTRCEVTFSLEPGGVFVLMGENGIGKTTLINRLYDHLTMTKVLIEQKSLDFFFDRSLFQMKEILLGACLNAMTVNSFLSLWEKFGLSLKEDRFLSSLSGGENQVLKLCCALSHEAQIYFLDEPSQFLDSTKKIILKEVLEKLQHEKKSLIIAEHDLNWMPSGWSVGQLVVNDGILSRKETWTT